MRTASCRSWRWGRSGPRWPLRSAGPGCGWRARRRGSGWEDDEGARHEGRRVTTNVLYVLNDPIGGATEGVLELLRGLDPQRYRSVVVSPREPDEVRRKEIEAVTD